MADLAKIESNASDDLSDLAVQPKQKGKISKTAPGLDLKTPDVNLDSKTAVNSVEQAAAGEAVGRGIVYEQGNEFLGGVSVGAQKAMHEVQQATEDVIGEVQEQSASYFRSLQNRFGG